MSPGRRGGLPSRNDRRELVRVDLYSVIGVRDRGQSLPWFEAFFGRPADEIIGQEYLWQVGENAWVVVDDRAVRADRVGGAMITFGVTGFDEILGRLAAHGITHEPVETYRNGLRHVVVLDPDGNSLSLAESPTTETGR
jgi:catechol 2,3-dioxygenase-like lactoylglutathione lyase family enzyme